MQDRNQILWFVSISMAWGLIRYDAMRRRKTTKRSQKCDFVCVWNCSGWHRCRGRVRNEERQKEEIKERKKKTERERETSVCVWENQKLLFDRGKKIVRALNTPTVTTNFLSVDPSSRVSVDRAVQYTRPSFAWGRNGRMGLCSLTVPSRPVLV